MPYTRNHHTAAVLPELTVPQLLSAHDRAVQPVIKKLATPKVPVAENGEHFI
jgi:hypothetical protein